MNRGGVWWDNWLGKSSYTKPDLVGIDQAAPWAPSAGTVPYAYCKSYDASGTCECFPEWAPPTSERNHCLTNNAVANNLNCLEVTAAACTLCKPGFVLTAGKCTCDSLTNPAIAECNSNYCNA
jgi:hypothetical protein